MNSREHAIYAYVSACGAPGTSLEDISERLGYTPQQVGYVLNMLVREGLIFVARDKQSHGLLDSSPGYVSNWCKNSNPNPS